jgi:DNA polymerase-4
VGKATGEKLARDGLLRIAQLQLLSREELVGRYGRMGAHLHDLSRGEDHRPVDPESPAKSISSETTFDDDLAKVDLLRHELWPLCEAVSRRLKRARLAGQVVHLKLKTSSFRLVARQSVLSGPTQLAETLYRAGCALLDREADGTRFRLIGIGVSGLCEAEGADLADLADPDSAKRKRIERAMDSVRDKLGRASIIKGRSLDVRRRRP